MKDLGRLKEDIVFNARLRGRAFTFHTTWGLFSPRRIDDGSFLLIERMDVEAGDVTLDLGCGYGAIGLAVAADSPNGRVHLVDKDFVAIEFARKNAIQNRLRNCDFYLSNALREVADIQFDHIASNLPAQVGRELLTIILQDAKRHLKPGGRLTIVTISGLRRFIRRNLEEVFGNYEKLKQSRGYTVARSIRE
ncbi:MAG: class I SAM-dependent methyltransferase [Candidatus Eisenbacteria sp.]|nr:class I SAM-dependent methyltransferase [Candidatus Eisenbacteria bacterium]